MWGIASVILGAISVIPFPMLGYFAPLALVTAIIALWKRKIGLGITGLILSIIGLITSPMLWVSVTGIWLKIYCMVADCAPVISTVGAVAQTPPAHSACRTNYAEPSGWLDATRDEIASLHGYADNKQTGKWFFKHKNVSSGSFYFHDSDIDYRRKPLAEMVDDVLAQIKINNPQMIYEKIEGEKNKNGYPITIIELGGLENRRSEVVSIIESPCSKEEFVLSAPTSDVLKQDFPIYLKAVEETDIHP